MDIAVRAATVAEYPRIREILASAFKTDDEARLWDYLVEHDPNLRPEGVRVATLGGKLVACTVVLPRPVRGRSGVLRGATVTLVACDPEHQNQGYGGQTVRDALAYMKAQGLSVGVLFGHPGYYPRFGFAPVLSFLITKLASDALPGEQELVPVTDLRAVSALYDRYIDLYPCSVPRTEGDWQWQLRNEGANFLRALPNHEGYAFYTIDKTKDQLRVHEAAASDADSVRRLLTGLCAEARRAGVAKVSLDLPADNALVRLALILGGEQSFWVAGPGMAVVTQWERLLPAGYTLKGDELYRADKLLLKADVKALTQLVLGYRTVDDLLLMEGIVVTESAVAVLRSDFPQSFPKWFLEPFWH